MPNIENFKGKFQEIARPNRFRCYGFGITDMQWLAKGAQLPSTTIGILDLNYMGRIIKMDGDRTYEDFTITIYGDRDMRIRREFETWNNRYNDPVLNTGATEKRDGFVELLDRQGLVVQRWEIIGALCSSIEAIDLGWENNDTALEFTVTLAYDYHRVS